MGSIFLLKCYNKSQGGTNKMDQIKIGRFISEMRKNKKLTQKDLADKLMLSDKTISKWECGNGLPDTSLMIPLCDILEISVNELLTGEIIKSEEYNKKAEENLVNILREKEEGKKRLIISFVTAILGSIVMTVMILFGNYIENITIKIASVIFGIIVFVICFINAVILDIDTGVYECKKCKHKFRPDLMNYLIAPHTLGSRYLKCPNCEEKSYCKHKLTRK